MLKDLDLIQLQNIKKGLYKFIKLLKNYVTGMKEIREFEIRRKKNM
jgi:hypothetical protein